ncbi:pentatricopeptide repeat-containing protein, putative [Ricinus communis]|uniref:Pentatricopeptide repeat-containing protein, putative n=1 Tax=Ricinus communis TaxID=3988 RepID=B9S5I3_RICCO|nr:pentatricopeptide repeat-containing protein, putative [Ricinus communis]
MAATLVYSHFSNSYTPEDVHRKQVDAPKTTPIPDVLVNSRIGKSSQFHKHQSKKPSLVRPNNLNLTRELTGFVNSGSMNNALDLFEKLNHSDTYIWNLVIRGFCNNGQKIHAKLIKIGLDLDIYVCNCLIDMYFGLGLVDHAENLFEEMPVRDLVSWNSMKCWILELNWIGLA